MEVSCTLQPCLVVHFIVWSLGWISGIDPILWAVERWIKAASVDRSVLVMIEKVLGDFYARQV